MLIMMKVCPMDWYLVFLINKIYSEYKLYSAT
jgi:hypothetical protein